MNNTTLLVIVVVVAVLAAVAVWLYLKKKRTERLRSRFGAEYDRLAESEGDARRAERTLAEREKRVSRLDIMPLSPEDCDRFARAWQNEQARFVDDPRVALANADRLVTEAMTARGYPMSDFDQRAEDISVDHAQVVENYRAGHAIALRDKQGEASTEELRRALLHYRVLFEELLDGRLARAAEVRR